MNTTIAILIGIAVYCAFIGILLAFMGIGKDDTLPVKEVRKVRAGTAWGVEQ